MYSWRGKVELMPPFEEKDGRVIMSAERFAITPNEGSKEAKMAQDNERPPLTAEALDAMLEQSAAFRHLRDSVSALAEQEGLNAGNAQAAEVRLGIAEYQITQVKKGLSELIQGNRRPRARE